MMQWLINNRSDKYNFKIVFANTSQENDETLEFVQKCSEKFGIEITWLEAVPRIKYKGEVKEIYEHLHEITEIKWTGSRLGTRHRVVDHKTACRDGQVYEAVIARYSIPNVSSPHCTRELKLAPINSYVRNVLKWKRGEYWTAIGIREDEFDRMNPSYKENKLWYPLITDQPMTKPKINFWWKMQDFRLELKGYQGNCKWCFKKSNNKLRQIAKETPEHFDFPRKMEEKYGKWVSPDRLKVMLNKGKTPPEEINFFRENRKSDDFIKESETFDKIVLDDSDVYDESCDIHSSCFDQK